MGGFRENIWAVIFIGHFFFLSDRKWISTICFAIGGFDHMITSINSNAILFFFLRNDHIYDFIKVILDSFTMKPSTRLLRLPSWPAYVFFLNQSFMAFVWNSEEKKITFHLDHDYMTTQQFEDRVYEFVYVNATTQERVSKKAKKRIYAFHRDKMANSSVCIALHWHNTQVAITNYSITKQYITKSKSK